MDFTAVAGFSYVEVIIATLLIAVTLVPALEALNVTVKHNSMHTEYAVRQYHLAAGLENLLNEDFARLQAEAISLGNPTTASAIYSDAAGSPDRRLVYLSLYDGDNADADNDGFTGVDSGLVWLRVQLENTDRDIHSLVSVYGGQ